MKLRHQVNVAMRSIKANPDWVPGVRHIAPASSPHAGAIVDLSVFGVAIVYQIHQREREVEVIDIFRPVVG